MKLLRPFNGAGAVMFPFSTCKFATKECRANCYARNDKEYDEELDVTEDDKNYIYYSFVTMPAEELSEIMVMDLDGLQTNILHWFGTGDCPKKDIDKIQDIMYELPDRIHQIGFTRNKALWEENKSRLALTLETVDEIKALEGLFAIPDYKTLTTWLHYRTKTHREEHSSGGCGGWYYVTTEGKTKKFSHLINCKTCLKKKVGCFYDR